MDAGEAIELFVLVFVCSFMGTFIVDSLFR